jgi:hypothetical protein
MRKPLRWIYSRRVFTQVRPWQRALLTARRRRRESFSLKFAQLVQEADLGELLAILHPLSRERRRFLRPGTASDVADRNDTFHLLRRARRLFPFIVLC